MGDGPAKDFALLLNMEASLLTEMGYANEPTSTTREERILLVIVSLRDDSKRHGWMCYARRRDETNGYFGYCRFVSNASWYFCAGRLEDDFFEGIVRSFVSDLQGPECAC